MWSIHVKEHNLTTQWAIPFNDHTNGMEGKSVINHLQWSALDIYNT